MYTINIIKLIYHKRSNHNQCKSVIYVKSYEYLTLYKRLCITLNCKWVYITLNGFILLYILVKCVVYLCPYMPDPRAIAACLLHVI